MWKERTDSSAMASMHPPARHPTLSPPWQAEGYVRRKERHLSQHIPCTFNVCDYLTCPSFPHCWVRSTLDSQHPLLLVSRWRLPGSMSRPRGAKHSKTLPGLKRETGRQVHLRQRVLRSSTGLDWPPPPGSEERNPGPTPAQSKAWRSALQSLTLMPLDKRGRALGCSLEADSPCS